MVTSLPHSGRTARRQRLRLLLWGPDSESLTGAKWLDFSKCASQLIADLARMRLHLLSQRA